MIWARHFHGDVAHDALGDCRIEPLDEPAPGPFIDPARFVHQVQRLGGAMAMMPKLLAGSTKADLASPITQCRVVRRADDGLLVIEGTGPRIDDAPRVSCAPATAVRADATGDTPSPHHL